jgi:hypothetical protein
MKFAESSINMLKEADHDLQLICKGVKDVAEIDFDISCTYRSIEDQKKAYKAGRSQLDGITNKSKHNHIPARAVDIYCYNGSHADYSTKNMCYMAGVFRAVSEDLYRRGVTRTRLRWGGNWDNDGEILTDQTFDDLPHYELI